MAVYAFTKKLELCIPQTAEMLSSLFKPNHH